MILSCAKQVFESLLSEQSGVKLFYVEEDEMETVDYFFYQVKFLVTGTMAIRQLHTSEYGKISHRMLSCYCSSSKYTLCSCYSPVTTDFASRLAPPRSTAGKISFVLLHPTVTDWQHFVS